MLKIGAKQIDIINIGLMLISLLIAIYLPFKLFLFSYAILGPLHYLTEINWLNEKGFFTQNKKKWILPLVVASAILGSYGLLKLSTWNLPSNLTEIVNWVEAQYSTFILTAFFFAVALVFFKSWQKLSLALILSFIISYALQNSIPKVFILIGIFVPTIIHVYLFTGLFMLWGARKSKSKFGLLAVIALLIIPVIIYAVPISETAYKFDDGIIQNFLTSSMGSVNHKLAQLFALKGNESFVLLSELGIRIQIFIAFAYTYHYLNWFSKTSIIGWQDSLKGKKVYLILVIWLAAVILYFTDFKLGFMALFFLSLLHVFLEFPLNVITIKDLFKRF